VEGTFAKSRARCFNRQELCLGVSDLPFRKETFDQYSELAKSVGCALCCSFLTLNASRGQIDIQDVDGYGVYHWGRCFHDSGPGTNAVEQSTRHRLQRLICIHQGKQRIVDFDLALCAHVLNDSSRSALVVQDVSEDLKMRRSPVWDYLADDPIKVSLQDLNITRPTDTTRDSSMREYH
jgi:hypothetical protein